MRLRIARVVALAGLVACSSKQSWDEISSEVYVHSLPTGASVLVDGKPAGTTPVSVPIPPGQPVAGGGEMPAEVQVQLDGYAPTRANLDRRNLPTEIVLVLAPLLPGDQNGGEEVKAPGWTDAQALGEVGLKLSAAGRCPEALIYFERALEVDPRLPPVLREGGRCHAKAGNPSRAATLLGRYLMALPDAKDAKQVQAELDAVDSGRTIDMKGIP